MFLHRSLLIFVQIVYFCTMNENEIYYHVRIAVRDSKDPQAYLLFLRESPSNGMLGGRKLHRARI